MAAAFTMIVVWVLIMVVMSGSALTSPSSAPSSGSRRGPVSGGAASKGAPAPTPTTPPPLSPEELWALREDARDMFYHAYDAYMKYGFPWDEVKPLSCVGRRWDIRERGTLDDSLGGFSLTLVDSLDMLAVVGDFPEFRRAVTRVIHTISFDRNVTVSVFETTIRVLGGLLSAHVLASDPAYTMVPWYKGELLDLALDLGWRLLPGFDTATGLPYHRVNLMFGVDDRETQETCTAAAGTLYIEFALLSRLTGVSDFEVAARRAVDSLWSRRSALNLVGSNIDVSSGVWKNPHSGTGAGIDSFYEYLFKASIMFQDDDLLRMFLTSRDAVNKHILHGDVHLETHIFNGFGSSRPLFISALQAFWPGLDVLAGFPVEAARSYRPLYQLWREYSSMPEMFELATMRPVHYAKDSPLRPELVESTFFLYTATRHESYLHAGKAILQSFNNHSKVQCGYASIADVETKRLDDRMDSYFLSETTKYLFLLFDSALLQTGHLALRNRTAGTPGPGPAPPTAPAAVPTASQEHGGVRGEVPVQVPAVPNTPPCLTSPGVDCVRGQPDANGSVVASSDSDVTVGSGVEVEEEVVVSEDDVRASLATTVRSNRSVVAALPFDPLHTFFTTEGHLFLLKPSMFKSPGWTRTKGRTPSLRARKSSGRHQQQPAPVTDSSFLRELTHQDQECPVFGDEDEIHGVPTASLQTYLVTAHYQAVEKMADQAQASKPKTSSNSNSKTNNAQETSIMARLGANGRFYSPGWTGDELFPSHLFEDALSDHEEHLIASGVEQITIHCKHFNCRALTTTVPGRRLRISVPARSTSTAASTASASTSTSTSATSTSTSGPTLRFDACSAQYGVLLSRLGFVDATVVPMSPFHACEEVLPVSGDGLVGIAARGLCSFAVKVANAQRAGVRALIIVDLEDTGEQGLLDPLQFSMSDGGTGTSDNIPSLLVQAGAVNNVTLDWAEAEPEAEGSSEGSEGALVVQTQVPFACAIGLLPPSCSHLLDGPSNTCGFQDAPTEVQAVPWTAQQDAVGCTCEQMLQELSERASDTTLEPTLGRLVVSVSSPDVPVSPEFEDSETLPSSLQATQAFLETLFRPATSSP